MSHLTSESMKLEMHGMKSEIADLRAQLAASQERERIFREGLVSIISLDEDSGWTHEVSDYEQGIITGREEAACIARKACKAAEEVKC